MPKGDKIHHADQHEIFLISMPDNYDGDIKSWEQQITNVFFFNNQSFLFQADLIEINNELFIRFNKTNELSCGFAKFIIQKKPKKYSDLRKRYFTLKKNV